jgi:hypothetical protein
MDGTRSTPKASVYSVSATADGVPPVKQEIYDMKQFLILGGLLMAASLIAPVAVKADGNDHRGEKRYYDRDSHDYHYWNADEDRQYRGYLVEQHRTYVPFPKVKVTQQREYFKYRHDHGLQIVVR